MNKKIINYDNTYNFKKPSTAMNHFCKELKLKYGNMICGIDEFITELVENNCYRYDDDNITFEIETYNDDYNYYYVYLIVRNNYFE